MTGVAWIQRAKKRLRQASQRRELLRAGLAGRLFFVFGCARSGTTSLCRILDQAKNGVCLLEPEPNLNRESRRRLDGQLESPGAALLDALLPRLGDGLAAHEVYGEKNNTLAAFVEELHNLLRGKLVWVVRDGRDTVASMHNWHNRLFGNFYRECKDPGNLSDAANACLAQLPLEADSCNTSRPRPLKGDPYYDRWPEMSRHEMLCWYWSHINRRVWERLQTIPPDRWLRVDYSAADRVEEVARAVDFLALCGISRETIAAMLQERINSLAQRTGLPERLPGWRDWSDNELDQFWEIAGATMELLGYGGRQRTNRPDIPAETIAIASRRPEEA